MPRAFVLAMSLRRVAFCTLALLAVLGSLPTAFAQTRVVTPTEADRMRIQRHLARVEAELRARDTRDLSAAAQAARARSLERLHDYAGAGVFPHNTQHPGERRPYFIDAEGRACAVGQLIIESGERDLAESVDTQFHNAYVPEMDDPRLVAWAEGNGFEVQELARIQPDYCACGSWGAAGASNDGGMDAQAYDPVCGVDGLTYWNECAASMCGGVEIAHTGACAYDFAICDVCGFGGQAPVVDECMSDGFEISEMVCSETGGTGIPTVNDLQGRGWLEIQKAGCQGTICFDDGGVSQPMSPCEFGARCWPSAGGAGGTGGMPASGGSGGTGGIAGSGGTLSGGGATSGSGGAIAAAPDAGAVSGGAPADIRRVASDESDQDSGCTTVTSKTTHTIPVAWLVLAVVLRWRSKRGSLLRRARP